MATEVPPQCGSINLLEQGDYGFPHHTESRYVSLFFLATEDKDQLTKAKNGIDTPDTGSTTTKQPGLKKKKEGKKERGTGLPKPKANKDASKLATEKEKEERAKEKLQKKKALDERDINLLGHLSQLNKSVIVVDEHGREAKEQEEELEKRKRELDEREKAVQRRESDVNMERDREGVIDSLKSMLAQGDNDSDDDEDYECEFQDKVFCGKKALYST